MATVKQVEDLEIWKESLELVKAIYLLSEDGKLNKDFGMRDQIRRSAVSVTANIAEGFEYSSNRQFYRFLEYSKGSCGELSTHLRVLIEIDFIDKKCFELIDRCKILNRKIASLMRYLKNAEKINPK